LLILSFQGGMETTIAAAKLVLQCGDITEQGTDAIVNAANPGLMGGEEWMVPYTGKAAQLS